MPASARDHRAARPIDARDSVDIGSSEQQPPLSSPSGICLPFIARIDKVYNLK
jgi:hypothetical protein